MRERLIELICEGMAEICGGDCVEPRGSYCPNCHNLAGYLLENGIIVPPCEVGDTVYVITTKRPCFACDFCTEFCHKNCRFDDKRKLVVKKATVRSIEVEKINKVHTAIERNKTVRAYDYTLWFDDFGKTVFLTKKEAGAALKEGVQG